MKIKNNLGGVLFSLAPILNFLWPLGVSAGESNDKNAKLYGQVKAVIKGIIAADNQANIEKVLTFYAEDAVLIAPSGANNSALDNIRENYEGLFGANDLKITNEIWETIISGPYAYSTGANCVTATSKAYGTKGVAYSKYLMVLKMAEGGRWKIFRLIWANQPAEEAEGAEGLHCRPKEAE